MNAFVRLYVCTLLLLFICAVVVCLERLAEFCVLLSCVLSVFCVLGSFVLCRQDGGAHARFVRGD